MSGFNFLNFIISFKCFIVSFKYQWIKFLTNHIKILRPLYFYTNVKKRGGALFLLPFPMTSSSI